MEFSKSTAIWISVLIAVLAFAMLIFIYVRGGASHVVHQ